MNVMRRYPSGRLHLHHFSSFPSSTWELGRCRDGQTRRRNCQWRSLAWRVQNKVREMRSTFTKKERKKERKKKKKQKKNAAKICSVLDVVARRLKGHVLWLKIVGRNSLLPWFSFIVVNLGAGLQFHSTTKTPAQVVRQVEHLWVWWLLEGSVCTRTLTWHGPLSAVRMHSVKTTSGKVIGFHPGIGSRSPDGYFFVVVVLIKLHLQTWEQNPRIFRSILLVVRNLLLS